MYVGRPGTGCGRSVGDALRRAITCAASIGDAMRMRPAQSKGRVASAGGRATVSTTCWQRCESSAETPRPHSLSEKITPIHLIVSARLPCAAASAPTKS